MRILHIDTGREMRGGQWQVLHLLQGLSTRGIASRLLSPKGSDLFQAARSLSLDVKPLRPWSAPLDAARFPLVHAHDAHAHTIGLFCPCPLVVARRVGFPIKESPFSEWKYRRPIHYLAVSKFVKKVLESAGIPPEKITIVYDGVRLPDRTADGDRSLVLALDSEDPGKGRAIVRKAAQMARIPVHFSDQLLRDLPRASLFLYISDMEGLGSAALLAMAYGATVIASKAGGLPEIVEDGATGLLTENEPGHIASAIERLLEDKPLATRMAARGRKQVERMYTIEHMVERTIRVYEKVLGA